MNEYSMYRECKQHNWHTIKEIGGTEPICKDCEIDNLKAEITDLKAEITDLSSYIRTMSNSLIKQRNELTEKEAEVERLQKSLKK